MAVVFVAAAFLLSCDLATGQEVRTDPRPLVDIQAATEVSANQASKLGGLGIELSESGRPTAAAVAANSAASRAGIRNGDEIVSVDGVIVSDSESVVHVIESLDRDSSLSVIVKRDNKMVPVTIDLSPETGLLSPSNLTPHALMVLQKQNGGNSLKSAVSTTSAPLPVPSSKSTKPSVVAAPVANNPTPSSASDNTTKARPIANRGASIYPPVTNARVTYPSVAYPQASYPPATYHPPVTYPQAAPAYSPPPAYQYSPVPQASRYPTPAFTPYPIISNVIVPQSVPYAPQSYAPAYPSAYVPQQINYAQPQPANPPRPQLSAPRNSAPFFRRARRAR